MALFQSCVSCCGGLSCLLDVLSKIVSFLYNFAMGVIWWYELWVLRVLFSDGVSVINGCSCLFWREFIYIFLSFTLRYVVHDCFE